MPGLVPGISQGPSAVQKMAVTSPAMTRFL
jgi:hypothetical protein